MNRELITPKIINRLNERLQVLEASLNELQDSIKQAPTPMESHSDTSRFQLNQLADNIKDSARHIKRAISEIKENKVTTDRVEQNSIIKIKKDEGESYYYISPIGLDEPLFVDGNEVRVISSDSPMARSLLGRKVGENVEIDIPGRSYLVRIIEIE